MRWEPIAIGIAVALGGYLLFGRKDVDGTEARRLVAEGALLLDVRTEGEFGGGHLDGAVNIPVQVLPQRLGELGDDKERPIVVYCASGMRSGRAKGILTEAGFSHVHDLGSIRRW